MSSVFRKLPWTPDTEVPAPLEVSTWVKNIRTVMDSPWPAWLQPSSKTIKEQTWKERGISFLKFVARGAGKLVATTATVFMGAVVAGIVGGAGQTLWGAALTVVGVIAGLTGQSGSRALFARGIGNLLSGVVKLGVGAAVVAGFMSGIGGAPALAAIAPVTAALSHGGVLGSAAASVISQGLSGGMVVHSGLAAAASAGAAQTATITLGAVFSGAVVGAAAIGAGLGELGAKARAAIKGWWQERASKAQETSKEAEVGGPSATLKTSPQGPPTTSKPREDLQARLTAAKHSATTARMGTESSSPSPTLLSSPSQTATREMISSTKVTLSEIEIQRINKGLQAGPHTKDAELTVQDSTPTFRGRDPVTALASCGNRDLQKLSYDLRLPAGSTPQQANELLSKAKDINISEVQIGTEKFKVEKTEGGYKVKLPEAPPLLSQRNVEAQKPK